jgi:hypothetical protein
MGMYTVKKASGFPVPSRDVTQRIIQLFPARESLVSDIPAEDGKTANLFYSVLVPLSMNFLSCRMSFCWLFTYQITPTPRGSQRDVVYLF